MKKWPNLWRLLHGGNLPFEPPEPIADKPYRERFVAHDRNGVRRIFDNETKQYSPGLAPELLAQWEGKPQPTAVARKNALNLAMDSMRCRNVILIDNEIRKIEAGLSLDTNQIFGPSEPPDLKVIPTSIAYPNCKFHPTTGEPCSKELRLSSDLVAQAHKNLSNGSRWNFNPWTGEKRDLMEVGSDPYGVCVLPPGYRDSAAEPSPATKWQGLGEALPVFGQVVMTERGLGCWLGTLIGKFIRADNENGVIKIKMDKSELFNATHWAVFAPPGLLYDTIESGIVWGIIDAISSTAEHKAVYPWP